MRIGHGFDAHKFSDEGQLILGGVTIPVTTGMAGSTIAIKPTEIVETQVVRNMTPGEIQARDQQNQATNPCNECKV